MGRIHVEWDPAAAVTPLGQLPFFIEFLKVSGLFDAWVADCPLADELKFTESWCTAATLHKAAIVEPTPFF